jgi:hypothetical protein
VSSSVRGRKRDWTWIWSKTGCAISIPVWFALKGEWMQPIIYIALLLMSPPQGKWPFLHLSVFFLKYTNMQFAYSYKNLIQILFITCKKQSICEWNVWITKIKWVVMITMCCRYQGRLKSNIQGLSLFLYCYNCQIVPPVNYVSFTYHDHCYFLTIVACIIY